METICCAFSCRALNPRGEVHGRGTLEKERCAFPCPAVLVRDSEG